MMVRSLFSAALGFGLLTGATLAQASDYSPPPPPHVPIKHSNSCHYFRADLGGAIYERPRVTADLTVNFLGFAVGTTEAVNETISDQLFVEGGWGCQFTDTLRVEVTGGWRLRENIKDGYNTLDSNIETYTGFVNFLYDITNYAGWTPFIGAGIGAAYHQISGTRLPVDSSDGDKVNFAWSLQGGVAYDLSDSWKVDFSYRFSDYGSAAGGGETRMQVRDIVAHEFKVGLRWHILD